MKLAIAGIELIMPNFCKKYKVKLLLPWVELFLQLELLEFKLSQEKVVTIDDYIKNILIYKIILKIK